MRLRHVGSFVDRDGMGTGTFAGPLEITPSALALYHREDIEVCHLFLLATVRERGPIPLFQDFVDPDRVVAASSSLIICDERALYAGTELQEKFRHVTAGTIHDVKPEVFPIGD